MDVTGEHRISALRGVVWAALNDANVLRECIQGCTAIDKTSDALLTYQIHATAGGKLAPLGRRSIDPTARKLAGQVFDTFQSYLNGAHRSAAE